MEGSLAGERGATMLEYVLFTSIVIAMVAGAVLFAQEQSQQRLDTGRSLYQCEQLCDPKAANCDC